MSSRRTEKYTLEEYNGLNPNRRYYVKHHRPDLMPIEIVESLDKLNKVDKNNKLVIN